MNCRHLQLEFSDMTKNNFRSAALSMVMTLTCLFMWSCTTTSAPQRTVVNETAPVKIVEATPLKPSDSMPVTTSPNVKAAHDEIEKQLTKMQSQANDEHTDEVTIVLKPSPGATQQKISTGVEPAKALGWLKNGNIRFLKQRLRSDGQSPADIRRLAKAQKPHTIVVSCSDSRVPPEIVFDQKLGEIFVIRTANESINTTVTESVDYALSHLETRHILILGHNDQTAENTACVDTQTIATQLENQSRLVRQLRAEKKIAISTALYDIETGKVDFNK